MTRRVASCPSLLLIPLLCAGLLVQCGGSDDPESVCVPSLLTGGTYAFRIGTVSDRCAGGLLAGLVPPGPYTVELPGFADLPATVTLDLPFVGEITARLSPSGNTIAVVSDPLVISGTIEYLGLTIDYEASAAGALCPVSPLAADLNLAVEVLSADGLPIAVDLPCRVVIPMTGTRR